MRRVAEPVTEPEAASIGGRLSGSSASNVVRGGPGLLRLVLRIVLTVILLVAACGTEGRETPAHIPTATKTSTPTQTATPTETPTPTPTKQIAGVVNPPEALCSLTVTVEAWVDTDTNGAWDEGETPLPRTEFWLHYPPMDPVDGVTDERGKAVLEAEYVGGGNTCRRSAERSIVAPEVPIGYRLTTGPQLHASSEPVLRFGFVPLIPIPHKTGKVVIQLVFYEGLVRHVEWDEYAAIANVAWYPGNNSGLETYRQATAGWLTGFPDGRWVVEDIIAEGDKAVARWKLSGTHTGEWFGIPPTNKQVSCGGTATFRIAGDKIVEQWDDWAAFGFYVQLGLLPPWKEFVKQAHSKLA